MFAIPSNLYFEARKGFGMTLGLISMHRGSLYGGELTGYLDVFVAIVGFPETGGLFNSILEFL